MERFSDFSADLEFVPAEEQLFQVVLDPQQSQVKVAVGEQMVAGFSYGSSLAGTVHGDGEGAHSSLQAGDIGLDLDETLCERTLQFVIQKFEVMTDHS